MTPFQQFTLDFSQKKILIFGLGLQGRGVGDTQLFHSLGCPIRVTDLRLADILKPSIDQLPASDLTFIFGEHRRQDIEWADVIIRNASVPWDHPLLKLARKLGKPIHMDTQLFVQYANIPVIGITGTRGKTTTTHLIHQLLDTAYPTIIGGNIAGIATLPLLTKITHPDTIAVLELSSWQLQAFAAFNVSPSIAVVTNLYPDHLIGTTMANYEKDKQAITLHQTTSDHVFLNQQQPPLKAWARKTVAQVHWYHTSQLPTSVHLKIPGQHNRENAAAAFAVATHFNLDQKSIITHLNQFTGVDYRLQTVGTYNGIRFVNDTTSTTPIATIKALEAIQQPILIFGGTDKQLPLEDVAQAVNQHTKSIVLLRGNGTEKIKPLLDQQKILGEHNTMKAAVNQAVTLAQAGDTVLLSPGFTSFELFKNEFDRGDQFNQAAANISAA